MRMINAGFLIGFAMLADELLCRFYTNDKRILKHHRIDEQRRNMKEYKKYINGK